jgi:lysyl-tRNA synthetase class 2
MDKHKIFGWCLLVAAVPVIGLAAFGWLFLLRPAVSSWPGPRVADALPLDGLAGHGQVPLSAFLLVWGGAAVVPGTLLRTARVDRLIGALALTVMVGLWLYALETLSLFATSGISMSEAILAATRLQAVYIPAALAGAAGALLGHLRGRPRSPVPALVALGVAMAGLVDIVSAVTPELRERLLLVESVLPAVVPRLASAAVAAMGVVLILLARGLVRRQRRAWQLALGLLAGSTVLHLVKGLDAEEAAFTGILALMLLARRSEFAQPGDPGARSRVAARAAAVIGSIYAYGAVALLINHLTDDRQYSVPFAIRETTRALLGLSVSSGDIGRRFERLFQLSVLLLGVVAAGSVLVAWLAPWRYRLRQGARERRVVEALVRSSAEDTLAPFALRGDNSYFVANDDRAFLAYRVVQGVALVPSGAFGPSEEAASLAVAFLQFARRRGWRIAVLGVPEHRVDLYRRHGLRAMYWGDEALIETGPFSLGGRRIRKVRQSVNRLQRAGYTAHILHANELSPSLRLELQAIERTWRGGSPRHGFVMELDHLFRLEDENAIFVIGMGQDGGARGFLHFLLSEPTSALSLSCMPRLSSTPTGFNEWLICEVVGWAREHGFARVSLNFAPFARLLDATTSLSPMQRLERRALIALKSPLGLQLDNLLRFNKKFLPLWEPRFVVYERFKDLPRVGIAALVAEGYLPSFGGRGAR